ncbi:MAG: prefoldin subunit alpha [Nitrosopumilaceae archaeon]|nr:prefoldin subunit alpha [Nitrosopumilaceae archaeon]
MSEVEQLYAETQMMEEMAVRLNADMRRAAAAVEEAAAAVSAIKSLRDGQESEVLLQLGMGAMLRAHLPSVERIPVDVGAGVVIEKSPDAAINYLEIRIKELKVSLEEMAARRDQVVGSVEQKRRRLEELAKSAQAAPNT